MNYLGMHRAASLHLEIVLTIFRRSAISFQGKITSFKTVIPIRTQP